MSGPRRVPVPAGSLKAGLMQLPEQAAHYIHDVLRLRVGDALTLFDGAGKRAQARVEPERCVLVTEIQTTTGLGLPKVTLMCSLSKGDKLDTIVEKATELGVSIIQPVISQRSVVQLKDERAANRVERWQRVAQAAARQCGLDVVPQVLPIIPLEEVLVAPSKDSRHILALSSNPLSTLLPVDGTPISLLSGPEGGFDSRELELAIKLGFVASGLGPLTLRAETAPIAALAVVMAHAGIM